MHAGHDVPELFIARIASAGGPYRVDDGIAVAYVAPSVGRLVALDGAVRTRCDRYERTAVPEIISAIVEQTAAPYLPGETLTLYFVDPAIARIQRDPSRGQTDAGVADSFVASHAVNGTRADDDIDRRDAANYVSYLADEVVGSPSQVREGEPMTLRASDRMTHAREPKDCGTTELATDGRPSDALVAQPPGLERPDEPLPVVSEESYRANPPSPTSEVDDPRADKRNEHSVRTISPMSGIESESRITVRLEWSAERVRRFIQVVDRLFTIDRLGWYRHSLAMRLLIPDEIRSGDELADVEAMRHLQALRSAAVAALGKPLLAACMPGFAVTSDWLETLESSREARAVAGLRDALLPYAIDLADDTNDRSRAPDASSTVGYVGRHALLTENATSVESFLPILIPTVSQDAALCARLTDYRNLLVELFAQTARASDPVRLGALAQPNHSLDDRLWQLVGAVGEAFGGFVHT